jgi:hypothetical protein
MADCFKFRISANHNVGNLDKLKFYLTIMLFMSVYYILINIKHIDIIKSIYPPFFDFIDKFNGCIESENEKKSMSVWYLLYLLVYIVLYAVIVIYIYININGLFRTLGDAVYVFIIMMVLLYIITNRIIFYDQCFVSGGSDDSMCFTPKCNDEAKPFYDFSSGKCVSDDSDQGTPPGDEPDDPSDGRRPRPGKRDRSKKETEPGIVGPPGPPGPPGPAGITEYKGFVPIIGKKLKDVMNYDNKVTSNKNIQEKDVGLVKEVKDDLTGVTEGFALLNSDKKINIKSNLKDVGNDSYKADNLMKVLENYLANMYSEAGLIVLNN